MSENEFNEQKTRLRIEAMEKEVQRLRSSSQKQSSKIGTLRRSLYFQLVFFVSLLSILLFKGLIMLPGIGSSIEKAPLQAEVVTPKDTVPEQPVEEDTVSHIIYNTHKGAIPKEDYDGIIFAIQIGAYTGIDLDKYEDNLLGIKQDTYEGINQFTLGEFIDYKEADEFLDVVRDMGFEDAFIMSFKNGRRINIQNALAMRVQESNKEDKVKEAYQEEGTTNNNLASTTHQEANESVVVPVSSEGIRL
ncbi:hypothetical protein [Carboxylicivirga linearis]|uniref:SPOR domain-containing protein n=1 Tax=Carboxylicivirga linearis TaxID=1628157 RepID=A0ABS5JPR9_9BACT|nr:hypothetical protein [Carboxylicivirga linearis]MBS2096877.1 hypothetical protein [Carboxylicivirga linearis]